MNRNMSEAPHTPQPTMRDDYEIMQSPDPRDIALSIEAATSLHNFVAQDYLPKLMHAFAPRRKRIALRFDEEQDITVFGSSFGRHPLYAPDLDTAQFIGMRLAHHDNNWRLRVRATRYRHDGTTNKVAAYYSVDVEEKTVLQAQLEARVITSNSDQVMAQLLDENAPAPVSRKIYERHIEPRDCWRLQQQLEQAANRCIALSASK